MKKRWGVRQVGLDFDMDTACEVNRIFQKFRQEHGFSFDMVYNKMIGNEFHRKVFIINRVFKPLIEEHIEDVRVEQYKNHMLSFHKTASSTRLKLVIEAECMELYFLIAILQAILKKLDTEKRRLIKEQKERISKVLNEVISKAVCTKKITSCVWYKRKVYFARISINGAKITLQYNDVSKLISEINETFPSVIKILEKNKKEK